jgi:O-antigen/teichoic acid export membrane protein
MFLVHVMLARTQTKEDYGAFVLSYSIFTFLAGLHCSTVLDPYTVYGAGRYRDRFPAYSRLMLSTQAVVSAVLAAALLLACLFLRWSRPQVPVRALLGLGFTIGIILTASFLRRSFYVRRQPAGAAAISLVFLATVSVALWIAVRNRVLDSFAVFLILGLGWVIAGIVPLRRECQARDPCEKSFLETEPHYWRDHWQYARWILAASLVFQFMHQGYYWLVAGFLSVQDVGELKAMYVLIAPVEQVAISLSFVVLPALTARYACHNIEGFFSLWKRYAAGMAGITLLFALAVRLWGTAAMHILYAGKYDSVAPLVFVLALVPLWTGVGSTCSDAIRAAERPRLVFYAYASSAAVTFAAGVPMVIRFGLRGAVYGMSLSAATYAGALAVAFWWCVARQAGRTRSDVQPALGLPSPEPGR